MTIRSIIMLLTIPLFLLVAVINAAVLYYQEQAELTRALTDQTLTAAVVTAEFAAELEGPAIELRLPQKRAAINAAASHIEGLQGLYLIEYPQTVIPLFDGSEQWSPPVEWQSTLPQGKSAQQASFQGEDEETPYFAAIIPAGDGRAIATRIDGSALFANRSEIAWIAAFIILGVSIFSAALSWFVARKVAGELRWNGKYLAAIRQARPVSDSGVLKMRETHDLSDAVRLIKSSHDAASDRHRRDAMLGQDERTPQSAASDIRANLFADIVTETGPHNAPVLVAVRICGDVPFGTFHAIVDDGETAQVVIGQCGGAQPADALANAAAARRFFEENFDSLGAQECRSLAEQAFGLEQMETLSSQASTINTGTASNGALQLACLASDEVSANAKSILANSDGLNPEQLLNTIAALLEPVGVFAAMAQK